MQTPARVSERLVTPPVRWPIRVHWPISVLVAAGLMVGLLIGNDFGMSADEPANAVVGEATLSTYTGSSAYFSTTNRADHGPVYFAFFWGVGNLIHRVNAGWTEADGRHLANYLTFLAGVVFLYVLGLRVMRRKYAWMAATLFATQPLIFGNAFINQKDIPFMTSFLAAVVLGMWAADGLFRKAPPAGGPGAVGGSADSTAVRPRLRAEWAEASPLSKGVALALVVLLIGFMVDAFWAGRLQALAQSTLAAAYRGSAPAPIQQLFSYLATDAYKTSLAQYGAKLDLLFAYARWLGSLGLLVLTASAWSLVLPSLAETWGFAWREAFRPSLIAAAVVLGLTVCIRQVGAFAGALVGLYMLIKVRQKAIFPVIVYGLLAALVLYLTWPFLWADPVGRYLASMQRAVDFPAHSVLFMGHWFASTSLPWFYLPVLSGLELTEPAVVLICLGTGLLAWRLLLRREPAVAVYLILVLWVAVPFLMLAFSFMSTYGIRQLLFLEPPLFIVAGLALDSVLVRARKGWLQSLLFVAILLPGVWADFALHPYEYIYFNAFTGGVRGAESEFGLDTWCISLRQGMEDVNRVAPSHATVLVRSQTSLVAPFARPDLKLTTDFSSSEPVDYVLGCTYRSAPLGVSGFVESSEVVRDKAVLTQVWMRKGPVK